MDCNICKEWTSKKSIVVCVPDFLWSKKLPKVCRYQLIQVFRPLPVWWRSLFPPLQLLIWRKYLKLWWESFASFSHQVKNHEITFHLDPPSLPENVSTLFYLVRLCREPGDPESRVCSEELSAGENVAITNVARGSVYSYSAKVGAHLRKCQFLLCFVRRW